MISIVEAGVLAPWVLVGGQFWLLYRIVRGQGDIKRNQERIQTQLNDVEAALMALPSHAPADEAPPALEIGAQAPDFHLPDLSGRERRLEEFLGEPLVVSFFSPTCTFCLNMAPRLGELSENGTRMLVISSGDPDENLRLASENKWRCDVLIDSSGEALKGYRISGTPSGYLISSDGRVASEPAVGADELLALCHEKADAHETLTAESLRDKQEAAQEKARQAGLALTESRINRQGLEPGMKAPDFVLTDLDGRKQTLTSFLDKQVLLVFSDPNCGPCDTLAPDLVRLHQQHAGNNLRVVMISRGSPAENQAKAKKHGFPFPVLLQKHWEVSKEYAMFATPVGYLIGSDGVVAKPVAIGGSSILDLVEPS